MFGTNSSSERWCAVLIDMQLGFLKKLREGEAERIIANQIEVIRYCCQNDIPVYVLEYRDWDVTHPRLMAEVEKCQIYFTFTKYLDDGFSGSRNFEMAVEQLETTHLFLMGINSCSCVKSTAEGALSRGYNIATSDDVISSAHQTHNSLDWYQQNGICLEVSPC